MMRIDTALTDAKRRLALVSASASLDAQLLLAEVMKLSRAHVLAYGEKKLTDEQAAQYEMLIQRRERGEPIAYLLGKRAFYDREFAVSPAVLIPRPETEHLLEMALEFAKGRPNLTAVDVGTGSGAIAVTFAANIPDATVYALDISPEALKIAQQNAALNHVKVIFFEGDLLSPLIERGIRVDLVMANLPYIATDDMHGLEVSRHEPHLALDGGTDGLDLIRELLAQVPQVCREEALILLEIGADQGEAAKGYAQHILPSADVEVLKDYAGHDRVVRIIQH